MDSGIDEKDLAEKGKRDDGKRWSDDIIKTAARDVGMFMSRGFNWYRVVRANCGVSGASISLAFTCPWDNTLMPNNSGAGHDFADVTIKNADLILSVNFFTEIKAWLRTTGA
ncbi:jg20499 [Pararge aegeria aegeria]|uniref:Jg20499 protein n=1 Tax=Pararge aegeria aegeria TaxID=348720 RepID=A0A8S4RSP7_9NEOP|nr:jg20499 [Pararge aegeria aegeria]